MDKKKVLVAMSGGVDSSAAAALLMEQGYTVAGATMQIWSPEEIAAGDAKEDAVRDAKAVAAQLCIDHYTFDFSEQFKKNVITPFINDYLAGRTPNPCVFCNKTMKFGLFLDRALEMGFDYIATGHYARVTHDENGYHLIRSASGKKDQTYVLYNMNQTVLSHLLLPVGGMEKPVIREYAERCGIKVASKPDSQEICFIPDDDYARYIKFHSDYTDVEGNFVDTDGKVIGRHMGIIHYTVGQRKGLGAAFGEPKYVVRVDAENNRVVLGGNNDTFSASLTADRVNFLSGRFPDLPLAVTSKVRYSGGDSPATVTPLGNGRVRVDFGPPVRAVTPGQSVVFYSGDELLGGGIIE